MRNARRKPLWLNDLRRKSRRRENVAVCAHQAEAASRGRMGAGEVVVGWEATWKIRTGSLASSGKVRPQRGHWAGFPGLETTLR